MALMAANVSRNSVLLRKSAINAIKRLNSQEMMVADLIPGGPPQAEGYRRSKLTTAVIDRAEETDQQRLCGSHDERGSPKPPRARSCMKKDGKVGALEDLPSPSSWAGCGAKPTPGHALPGFRAGQDLGQLAVHLSRLAALCTATPEPPRLCAIYCGASHNPWNRVSPPVAHRAGQRGEAEAAGHSRISAGRSAFRPVACGVVDSSRRAIWSRRCGPGAVPARSAMQNVIAGRAQAGIAGCVGRLPTGTGDGRSPVPSISTSSRCPD